MDITVFYAWQSDRSGKVNRFLIRNEAKAACERISEDETSDWDLELDSDTKGVAGMKSVKQVKPGRKNGWTSGSR